jgi:hypothetical protein
MNVLRGFASAREIDELRGYANRDGWRAGRQGTGYETLSLRDVPHPIVARALALIGEPFEDFWDVYLIRYNDGAHIPDHVDEAQHGRQHRRLNVLLEEARAGGELRIAGAIVELSVGDAVLFDPDRDVHTVSRVEGTRMLFSVGAWI